MPIVTPIPSQTATAATTISKAAANALARRSPVTHISASYDAASRSAAAAKQFAGADYFSADTAMSPSVRHLISSRARNEFANNSFAYGMVDTLAIDTIGTGARLQLVNLGEIQTPPRALARRAYRWSEWCRAIRLASLLRCARIAKAVDGEAFLVMASTGDAEDPLAVDIYEPECVASEWSADISRVHWRSGHPAEVDGIRYDRRGRPVTYRFWRIHPGEGIPGQGGVQVPAALVMHYSSIIRPGQHRGISQMLASLHVFNDLRRYSTAVVMSAEIAANISFIISNNLPAEEYEAPVYDEESGEYTTPLDRFGTPLVEFGRAQGLVLPDGYKTEQLHAEQPTQTYPQFLKAKITEAARPFHMPYIVAAGDASGSTYASARTDHQSYHRAISLEREDISDIILRPLYRHWQDYDRIIHPEDYAAGELIAVSFTWDAFSHIDPVKEAAATVKRLAARVSTLQDECAANGKDYNTVLAQAAREYQAMAASGMPLPSWIAGAPGQNN